MHLSLSADPLISGVAGARVKDVVIAMSVTNHEVTSCGQKIVGSPERVFRVLIL